MLINLESVERNYLSLRKSGVDEALRPMTTLSLITITDSCYTNLWELA